MSESSKLPAGVWRLALALAAIIVAVISFNVGRHYDGWTMKCYGTDCFPVNEYVWDPLGILGMVAAGILLVIAYFIGYDERRSERLVADQKKHDEEAEVRKNLPLVREQVTIRDDGKCHECGSTAAVKPYYVKPILQQPQADRTRFLLDTDNLVCLCPQHVRFLNDPMP